MVYKIIISLRAQKEIENAIDYYALYSREVPIHFISVLKETYKTLQTNPFFRICYKNVRVLKLKRFPYSLYFTIDENKNVISVLSCFHNKLNPSKRPKY